MLRICQNNITDHLREHFGANPLKVPEARIRPMCLIEVRDKSPKYLGQFRFLVKGNFNDELPVSTEPVAAVSDKRTANIDFDIGFEVLGGFLKALGADPAAVAVGFSKARKLALTFSAVRRSYIDPLQLGKILSSQQVFADVDNFMIQPLLTNRKVQLALITDVIVSNNFSLSTYTESDTSLEVDIPAIEQAIANTHAQVKVEKKKENEVSFQGPNDLTFAFTCLEIKIDPVSGKISRGDWLRNIKSATGQARTLEDLKEGESLLIEKLMIDDNEKYPLLIEM